MKLSKAFIIFFLSLFCAPFVQAESYKRIVSLAPSITESLYQLKAQDNLIAVTSFCNYPPQAKTKEIIGTLLNPNIEKIYSLSPDLILAVEGTNRPQPIEKLKSLGLKVVVFEEGGSIEDIMKNFILLGELTGRKKEAESIAQEVREEIKFISGKIKDAPRKKVFWQVSANPLMAAGQNSFANEIIKYAGGENIVSPSAADYPHLSYEEVIKKNPDVIILVTMGNVTEKEKETWQRFGNLDAVRFSRIYVVDADKVCRPTPLSFLKGLKEIVRLLHPEVFGEGNQS